MQMDDRPKRRGCLRRLLGVGFVCFVLYVTLLVVIGDDLVPSILVRLLIGWAAIARTNGLQLSPNPVGLLTALGGAIAALIGLHLLALAWRKRRWPDLPRWKPSWSCALFIGLLSCSLAAIAFAGVAHQIAWLKNEPSVTSFRRLDMNYLAALDIAEQLERHANSRGNGGRYPDSLNEVIWEHGGMSALQPDRMLLYQENQTATPEPWLYYGKGLTTRSLEGSLIFAAPRSVNGQRWVVLTPQEPKKITDAEYHALVSQLHSTAQNGSPSTE